MNSGGVIKTHSLNYLRFSTIFYRKKFTNGWLYYNKKPIKKLNDITFNSDNNE